MEELVQDLYSFRDRFFETHPIEKASEKRHMMEQKMKEVLDQMDELSLKEDIDNETIEKKARRTYLKGRVLNVASDHCAEAEQLLSRAVKLEPNLVDAWIELGECYWKRGDVNTAKTCFEGALSHGENKVALRNLSIVMRQKASESSEDRLRNIEAGLTRAREAVNLDPIDGISWSILGNAYLAHYFSVSQNPHILNKAMSAYKNAEKDIIALNTPELHHNKGIALKYEEDYSNALKCFKRAQELDPTWEAPKNLEKILSKFLTDVKHLIELKGKLKTKRYNAMVQSIDSKSLGHFAAVGRKDPYEEVTFSELNPGVNEGKVILGKVICSVHSEDTVPFTFCLTDKNSNCVAVNLYNLAPGKGVIIGDSVAISDPELKRIDVQVKDEMISLDVIRVESPRDLVINGKKASGDFVAGIELSTFAKSD